jgi:murein peptide amidase A
LVSHPVNYYHAGAAGAISLRLKLCGRSAGDEDRCHDPRMTDGLLALARRRTTLLVVVALAAIPLAGARALGAARPVATTRAARPRTVLVGRSLRGRAIVAHVLGPDSARRKILLVGCIHGNECAGRAILARLEQQPLATSVQLWLVPSINPDGAAADTRQNARGVDLNRNFPYLWRAGGEPTYYAGPHPASEPETRAAMRLIAKIEPAVTIWYHQHEDLVDMAGGDRGVARRYAQLSGLRATCLPFLPGTASAWSNHNFAGTTSFVVELPAGPVGAAALTRHLRALHAIERGERSGSRTSCGG